MKKTKIPIILGPTSTGKTSISLKISKELGNCSILSADSRQVYKKMDIGTGKIPANSDHKVKKSDDWWEINGTKIYGYDLVEPEEFFSGYEFAKYGINVIRAAQERGTQIIIAGGTGFYIDLLTGEKKPSKIKPDHILREELQKYDVGILQKRLKSLNAAEYKKIDVKNKVRLIRAIEKISNAGKTGTPLPYLENANYVHFGLRAKNEYLYSRADKWLEEIWKNGLIEEVKRLIDQGLDQNRKLRGLVYRSALAFIEGSTSESDAKQRAKYDLHAYIRRQVTWFKKYKNIVWFDIEKMLPGEIAAGIIDKLSH